MKFNTQSAEFAVRAAAEDAVSAATEALILGQDLIAVSADSKDLMDVVCNIMLVRDIIQKNGLKASYHMTKSVQSFADSFALEAYKPGMDNASVKLLEAKYVEASMEGVKEMWTRFLEALKTLWAKLVQWIKTTFSMRGIYLNRIKDKLEKFDGFDSEASVKAMKKDDTESCIKVIIAFHDIFKQSAATRLPDVVGVAIPFFANTDHLIDAFDACGITLSMKGSDVDMSSAGRTIDDLYPVAEKKASELGYTSGAVVSGLANSVEGIESKADFKKCAGNCESFIKKTYDEIAKTIESVRTGDSDDVVDKGVVESVRTRGQLIRVVNKAITLENTLMVRVCKTVLALLDAKKKEAAAPAKA